MESPPARPRGDRVLPVGSGEPTPGALLKDLKARFPFRFKKGLSQHFLVEPAILDRIAVATGAGEGDWIVEAGAGAGFLTRRLLATGARVLAVEVDRDMAAMLRHVIGFAPRLTLIEGDLLEVDVPRLLRDAGAERCVVAGNLPYHITSPALFRFLDWSREHPDFIERMVLMVQREVGERIAAGPGSKAYGRLSVEAAFGARVLRRFDVAPGSFVPRPKVHSTVLELTPVLPALTGRAAALFHRIVRASFGERRKTLANGLASLAGKEAAARLLAAAGVPPSARGETLAPAAFIALSSRAAEEDAYNNVQ